MKYGICFVPVSPIRVLPLHECEMSSQLIFGECAELLESMNDEWYKIKCKHDGYTGYCQSSQILEIDEGLYSSPENNLIRKWTGVVQWRGSPLHVPMGSVMTGMVDGVANWAGFEVRYDSALWDPRSSSKNPETIRRLAMEYLNTGYLWGARTVYGADCSGFTQVVCRFLGVDLARDAWQQAGIGERVHSVSDSICGDLAYFADSSGKIIHVGIVLDHHHIIHASGRVRIDRLTDAGIINYETQIQSYSLAFIQRVL